MAAAVFQVYHRPPPLYRLARALRRLSLIVLVLLILFTASAIYSAYETARSSSQLGPVAAAFAANGTLILTSTLTLGNNGFYPVQGLSISVRLSNATGTLIGSARIGPTNLPSQGTLAYPLTLYVPITGTGAGPSLLIQDQSLPARVWANATFGYLFPVGLAISDNRSWGAPFSNLEVTVGSPMLVNGSAVVDVTLSFTNHAPLTEVGQLQFAVVAPNSEICGSGSFVLDVPSGTPYDQTTTVTLASGCSPAGGQVTSAFVAPGYTVVLPPESIP